MRIKILFVIIGLLGAFVSIIILSDFFMNKKEIRINNKYSVLHINGEYNLMQKEKSGYSLTVPSILNVYIKNEKIIVESNLKGDQFINNNYNSLYINSGSKYYYYVEQYDVQEISKEKFLQLTKTYNLIWNLE